ADRYCVLADNQIFIVFLFQKLYTGAILCLSRGSAHEIAFACKCQKSGSMYHGFLTSGGRKFRPPGGTFVRLWNGPRSVPLVGETVVSRQLKTCAFFAQVLLFCQKEYGMMNLR
ncbi:MAG: hypothetical protein ACLRVN_07305, partial [Butyricicoccus sp.]